MLKNVDTIRYGFKFCENAADELFGYLEKCEIFYDQCIYFNVSAKGNITYFFNVKELEC